MRGCVVVVLAIATSSLAAPPAATVQTPGSWADWVGDWDGKLKWSSCTLEGSKVATLAIEATDGVIAIDLTGAGDSLGPLTLVEDGASWVGQHSDVTVHVTRGKAAADTLDVAVDLDSGCAMRTTVHRPTTGIASCDRLAAWARIEARCSRLGRPPLENPARLARQRETWTSAPGAARGKIGAQCDARAAKVETELVDVGCAPNPDPAIGLRGAACQALRKSAAKLARCPSLPSGVSSALEMKADALAAAAQTADDATLPTVDAQCAHTHEEFAALAQKYGCPP